MMPFSILIGVEIRVEIEVDEIFPFTSERRKKMAGKRKNGEGSWGTKTIKGKVYRYYRDVNGKYFYGKTEKEIKEKIKNAPKDKNLENGKDHSLALVREENEECEKQYSHVKKGVKTTDRRRVVPLPDKAIEVIQYFERYRKSEDDFIFVNEKNQNHYTRRLIEKSLARIVKNSECQVKTYTPHSLRHGYGSILLSKGTDIKVVSELLGHSDVAFTYNVYIDVYDQDKQKAVEILNSI